MFLVRCPSAGLRPSMSSVARVAIEVIGTRKSW